MPVKPCLHCHKQFSDSPCRIGGRRYCSQACYVSHRAETKAISVPEGFAKCSKCRAVKPFGMFYTQGENGRAHWCKECRCGDERRRRREPELVSKFHGRYETDMDFRANELLRAVGKRCRRKGLAFDLDREWLSSRLKHGACELTGLKFDMSVRTRLFTAYTPSIDRIVAADGYTKANCRLVLMAVNAAMNTWGWDVFVDIAAAIVKRSLPKVAA